MQRETERNKAESEREMKKLWRAIGEEEKESVEAHMNEKTERDRKAPKQREGGVQGKRGKDKSKIPRGGEAGGMQIEAGGEMIISKSLSSTG